jgi:hypothetical protein
MPRPMILAPDPTAVINPRIFMILRTAAFEIVCIAQPILDNPRRNCSEITTVAISRMQTSFGVELAECFGAHGVTVEATVEIQTSRRVHLFPF